MKKRMKNVKKTLALVLAVLMLGDAVNGLALTAQADGRRTAETTAATEQQSAVAVKAAKTTADQNNEESANAVSTQSAQPVQLTYNSNTTTYANLHEVMSADGGSADKWYGDCVITLTDDASLDGACWFRKGNITLDLNGHTLTTGSDAFEIYTEYSDDECNFIIKSSKSGGKITGAGYSFLSGYEGVLSVRQDKGTASCTIQNDVTIEATASQRAINARATLNIEDGVTLISPNGINALYLAGSADVTVNGGNFNGRVYRSAGKLQIKGGTFEKGIRYDSGTLAECFNGYGLKKTAGDGLVDLTTDYISESVYVYQIPFRIMEQPALTEEQASVIEGYTCEPPTLSVAATKNEGVTGDLSYEWRVKKQMEGQAEVDESINGATKTTFQIPAGLEVGTYHYYCRVTCDGNSIDSDAVTFTVQRGLFEVDIDGTKTLYAGPDAALDAISTAIEQATGKTDITLTLRAPVNNSAVCRVFNAEKHQVNLTVDLNGYELGYCKSNGQWDNARDKCCIGVSGAKAKLTVTDSSEGGTGELHGAFSATNGAKLNYTGGKCTGLYIESGAKSLVTGGSCESSIIGNLDDLNGNIETSCEFQGGSQPYVRIYGGAELTVTESYTGKIDNLRVLHSAKVNGVSEDKRAKISLAGGSYGNIALGSFNAVDELPDSSKGYAIADMLAEGYAMFNNGFKLELDRSAMQYKNVEVKPADTPDSTDIAVAKIVENGTKVTYYTSWEDVLEYLPAAGYIKAASVEIILLKDIDVTSAASTLSLRNADKYVLKSQEGSTFTITGDGGTWLKLDCISDFIVENITIKEGTIESVYGSFFVRNATLHNSSCKKPVITKSCGALNLEDGARLLLDSADDNIRTIEMLNGSTADIEKGSSINPSDTAESGKYGILISGSDSILYVAKGADGKSLDVKLSDAADMTTVFWSPDYVTDLTEELKEKKAAGEDISLYYMIKLPENVTISGGDESPNRDAFQNRSLRDYNENLYALQGTEITVENTVCAYQYNADTEGQVKKEVIEDNKFTMPASTAILLAHEPDEYGYCANCKKTDLAVAYANGHLNIDGLKGRTYDSWPQMLTGIKLVPGEGQAEVTLTMPSYIYSRDMYGKSALFSCGTPCNDDADFEVRYANNTAAYLYGEGDEGFDAAQAPKVTITGRGQYTGEFCVYFTIGKGKMRNKEDFEVCGSGSLCIYDGRAEKAWANGLAEFYTDSSDEMQWRQCGSTGDISYITQVTTPDVMNTFSNGSICICPITVEYSIDEKATWIMERLDGGSAEDMYMITDAGEYPFYVRMSNVNCTDVMVSDRMIAKITPKVLSGAMVTDVVNPFAYYTGKETECTAYDSGVISDRDISVDGSPYKLVKSKDYTITYDNNIDVTTDSSKAKMTIKGIGNYGGESSPIEREFDIKYAFTPEQTAASKDKWYTSNVTALFGEADDSTNVAEQLLYCNAKDANLSEGLGGDIKIYDTLADAVDGTGEGYVFTKEGKISKTLYVRDIQNGYVGSPVKVTLHIDKTAPTWEATADNSGDFGISIKENWWKKLLNTASFGEFYNDTTLDLVIRANDAKDGVNETSGVAKYFYYIDTVDASALSADASGNGTKTAAVKTKAELDTLKADGKFTEVAAENGGATTVSDALSAEGHYIVYAYAVDGAGNVSDYICTEGMVVDRTAPEITSITAPTNEAGTLSDHTASVTFEANEAGKVVYFYIGGYDDNSRFESDKAALQTMLASDSVVVKQVNGKWQPAVKNGQSTPIQGISQEPVIYNQSMQEGENVITLSGLKADKGYCLYLMMIDEAGNLQTAYKTVDFTTRKVMPAVSVSPTLSGTYGTQAKNFTIGDGTMVNPDEPDTVLKGKWTFTDTAEAGEEYPVPGTTKEYELTFTPDDTSFDSVSVKVVPTVAKKKLTVYVEGNLEKTYHEANPEIGYVDVADEQDSWAGLVNGDTQDSVKADMKLVTKATKTSDAGTYDFTVTSANEKYDVKVKYRVSGSEGVSYPEHGTLTVKKADAALTVGTDSYTKTFGDDAFTLDVTASHTETDLVYAVTDGTDVVSVTADGKVKILKAGTAKIKVALPKSKNYNAAADREITVTVAKKSAPTVADLNRNYYYSRNHEDSIDIGKLLPADCGKITDGVISAHMWIENSNFNKETGILTYTIKKNETNETHDITLTVETENYNTITVVIHTSWVDKSEVYVKAGTEVTLKNSVMTYGDRLSTLTFENAEFVDGDGNPVKGTLAWEDESLIPAAGTASANWKFTPDDEAYIAKTDSVGITVNKATPQIDQLPAAIKEVDGVTETEFIYNPSQTLADFKLSGGSVIWTVGDSNVTVTGTWSFHNQTTVLSAGTKKYEAIFTPDDTNNYKTFAGQISVTVAQAKPYVASAPVAAAITYGDTLGSSALTGGSVLYGDGRGNASALQNGQLPISGTFTWKQTNKKPTVADSNRTEYTVVFTPVETELYRTVEFPLTLTVNKALNPPAMPAGSMDVSNTCEKVSDVVLPDGWVWQESDRNTALQTGVLTQATAIYTGADKENYEHLEIVVMLNRTPAAENNAGETGNTKEASNTAGSSTGSRTTGNRSAGTVAKPDVTENSGQAPFIKGENGKEGWDVICEDVKQASKGDKITVDMNGTTVVPEKLFDQIRGENVTVVFDMGNGITWSVNGKDVTADSGKDIDFGVKFGTEAEGAIPVEVINSVTGEKSYMSLSLSHDGEFGFKAVLSLNVDKKNAGLYASLYYFNEQTGEMEFICEEEIGKDGSVELTFNHASDYIIVIDEKAVEQKSTDAIATPAQEENHTGWWIFLIGAVVVASALVVVFVTKKRKKDDK